MSADATVVAQRPWWLELGSVLPRSVRYAATAACPQPDDAVPSLSPSPLTFATVALDELTMSAAYLLTRSGAVDVTEATLSDGVECAALLRRSGVVDDPLLLHPDPGVPSRVRVSQRMRAGIDFEHVSFESTWRPPVALPGHDAWRSVETNRRVHAYLLRADGSRLRPWLLVLHGHRMGEPRDLRMLGSVRIGRDLGVNIAHLVLPNHGPRGRGGAHPFPGLDPVANLLGMSQAASDARALLAWLRDDGASRIGVFGVSLGGHVTALLAGLDDDLSCVVAGVPTSDIATMMADSMRVRWGDETVAASHMLDDAPRELSRLVSPLTFEPLLPVEHRHLYAAIGDRLVTPQQALSLWHHWDRPDILWLQGGHILNNVRASRRFVTAAMRSAGVSS